MLKSHRVEFLVVGAHALGYYGTPRFTEDLGIFLHRSRENALRLQAALKDFGIAMPEETVERLAGLTRGMIVIGQEPNQVDFLTLLDGVDFQEAFSRHSVGELGGQEAPILSLRDFVASKRASGRPKDLLDLALLEEKLGPL